MDMEVSKLFSVDKDGSWVLPSASESLTNIQDLTPWKWLYTPFERNYDGIAVLEFSRNHYWMGPVASIIYLGVVYLGRRAMIKRKPFDLAGPLRYWNLLLAIFSICGMFRMLPYVLYTWSKYGWSATLCTPPIYSYGRRSAGLWTSFFIYSKYFELVDTMFIILRKRHLSFLHWYHHATVLVYTWDAYTKAQPPGLHFCAMNYTVHAAMYTYYYLAAAKSKPPQWGVIVTLMQIVQMVIGVTITGNCLYLLFGYPLMDRCTSEQARDPLGTTGTCYLDKTNILLAAGMYSTYLYLFAEFFISRYVLRKRFTTTTTTVTKSQSIEAGYQKTKMN